MKIKYVEFITLSIIVLLALVPLISDQSIDHDQVSSGADRLINNRSIISQTSFDQLIDHTDRSKSDTAESLDEIIQYGTLPSPVIEVQQTTASSWDDILSLLGLKQLHDNGYNGSGIRVGILDNGVDLLHLAYENRSITQQSFYNGQGLASKTHGTPVSATILGDNSTDIIGAAPGVDFYSAEMGSDETDTTIFGNFTEAMEWMAANQVDVVNVSFGGLVNWTRMVNIAQENNIILVGSAGNDGSSIPPSGPGSMPYAISVGAYNHITNSVAAYSSRGSTVDYLSKPDLVAHGTVETLNVVQGSGTYSGTSFSSPLVAGGIAVLLHALDDLAISSTPKEIKSALIQSATPIDASISEAGAGLVNFSRALELLFSGDELGVISGELATEFEQIPIGISELLPMQIIRESNMSIAFTGNLDLILTASIDHTNEFPITISTFGESGLHSGDIEVYNTTSDLVDSLSISILVEGELKGKVGFDFIHSDDYINGESNLLNSHNNLAEELRNQHYWPVYIRTEFTTDIMLSIDYLIIENYLDGNVSLTLEGDLGLSLTELVVLQDYINLGGKLLVTTHSMSYTGNTDKLDGLEELLRTSGLQLDRNHLVQPLLTTTLNNRSSYGRQSHSFSSHGLDILGGQSMLASDHVYSKDLVHTNSSSNVVFSSDLLPQDIVADIIQWQDLDNLFLSDINQINDELIVQVTGSVNEYQATSYYYGFNSSLLSISQHTLSISQDNNSATITIPLQNGIYRIVFSDPDQQSYLQLSINEFSDLRFDNISPQLLDVPVEFVGNASDFVTGYEFSFPYMENDGIDQLAVLRDNQSIAYILYETELNFTLFIDTDNPDLEFNITIILTDYSNNTSIYEFSVKLEDDLPKISDDPNIVQTNQNFIDRITSPDNPSYLLLIIVILLTAFTASVFKLLESKRG